MDHLQTDAPILLFLRSGDNRGSKMAARLLMSLELQYIESLHCVTNSDNHWCISLIVGRSCLLSTDLISTPMLVQNRAQKLNSEVRILSVPNASLSAIYRLQE